MAINCRVRADYLHDLLLSDDLDGSLDLVGQSVVWHSAHTVLRLTSGILTDLYERLCMGRLGFSLL